MHSALRHKIIKTAISGRTTTDDDRKCNESLTRDNIPLCLAYTRYTFFALVSIIAIPHMFRKVVLHHHRLWGRLTNMNMAYNYGKVALFIIAAWASKDSGVVAGLLGCGLIKSIVSISVDLIHNFKTRHLTLTSPRAMLISQAIRTAMRCVVAPLTFFIFYKVFAIGNPDESFKAPYALIYRNTVILGIEGFSALPRHCLQLCYDFFGFAITMNMMRDVFPVRYGRWIPLLMAMAVLFLVRASFAVDMCIRSLIVFGCHNVSKRNATVLIPVVASGLIYDDGLWILPSLLALSKIKRPICMKFVDS